MDETTAILPGLPPVAGKPAARQSGCEGSVNLDEKVSPDA
jgi:hypothetical protein